MFPTYLRPWFACLALQPLLPGAALAARPPAEAFGAIPHTDAVTLSPDGKLIAWGSFTGADTSVLVFDIEARKIKRTQRLENGMNLRGMSWADSEILLVTVSMVDPNARHDDERYEFYRTFALDTGTGATKFLLMSGGYRSYVTGAGVYTMHSTKPKTVVMVSSDYNASNSRAREHMGSRLDGHRKDSGWALSVFEVSTVTGEGTLVEAGNPFTRAFVLDNDGRVVARSDWNPDGKIFSVLVKQGAGWKEIYHAGDGTQLYLAGLNAAGTAIIAVSNQPKDSHKALSLPLDGSAMQVAFEDATREVNDVALDRFSHQPVAVLLGGPRPEYQWLDPADQARKASVQRAFPGKSVELYSESQDRQRIIAYVYGPSVPQPTTS
jgi:hypothetical protein